MPPAPLDAVLIQVILLGSGLALLVKVLVDTLKQTNRVAGRVLPWATVGLGIFFCLMVQIPLMGPRLKRNWPEKKKLEVRIRKRGDAGAGEPKRTRTRKQSGCERLKQD